jgi:hypothetical protein
MRSLHKLLVLAVACHSASLALANDKDSTSPFDPNVQDLTLQHQGPPMLGIHWSREDHASHQARPTKSPLMTYHGGKIMTTASTQAIFWGASWNNASFASDKVSGLDTWYAGHNNANYAKASDEYAGSNGQVGAATSHLGHLVDGSTAAGGNNTSVILAEVCKMVASPEPNGNGYYAVYSDVKRGSAQYCAYHSAGTCHGVAVQFAFFFNLDGDSGCDPQDTSGLHSQGLTALANVTAHELSEARTDPASPGAWYDGAGQENGDKCAWTFGAPLVTLSNGTQWKLQGEWSNAAYNAGTGYPNSSGQRGCLSGL